MAEISSENELLHELAISVYVSLRNIKQKCVSAWFVAINETCISFNNQKRSIGSRTWQSRIKSLPFHDIFLFKTAKE